MFGVYFLFGPFSTFKLSYSDLNYLYSQGTKKMKLLILASKLTIFSQFCPKVLCIYLRYKVQILSSGR